MMGNELMGAGIPKEPTQKQLELLRKHMGTE
jgi:hypothetical protein